MSRQKAVCRRLKAVAQGLSRSRCAPRRPLESTLMPARAVARRASRSSKKPDACNRLYGLSLQRSHAVGLTIVPSMANLFNETGVPPSLWREETLLLHAVFCHTPFSVCSKVSAPTYTTTAAPQGARPAAARRRRWRRKAAPAAPANSGHVLATLQAPRGPPRPPAPTVLGPGRVPAQVAGAAPTLGYRSARLPRVRRQPSDNVRGRLATTTVRAGRARGTGEFKFAAACDRL